MKPKSLVGTNVQKSEGAERLFWWFCVIVIVGKYIITMMSIIAEVDLNLL